MILANTENNTVKEISRKAGIKEEAVYHLLEFLTLAGVVEKKNDRYDVDSIIRTIAQLLIELPDPNAEN
uniref:Transcription regulator TrmB N-terminal domain-containing protein n=1 Tax=Saccharolobus islandicus TaxID=43080 RepID=Q0ZNM4_SACIS|nr:helix-turn-helix domain-containing protein [Sulfolobus islandicus]ABE99648.1 hypothetical protein [Sulfolobus islandicus]ABE99692.1 hypothetical protein [Sulfolobus islandicus]